MECGGSFTLLAPIFEGSLKGPPLLQLLPKRKIPAAKRAKVIEGHPMLREAAVNAAQQWNFVESSADNRVAMLTYLPQFRTN